MVNLSDNFQIGWYNENKNHFLCVDCFEQLENVEKSGYKPVRAEDLKTNIYTCDKCGKEFTKIEDLVPTQKVRITFGFEEGVKFGFSFGMGIWLWSMLLLIIASIILWYLLKRIFLGV
jgi:hypothetical protein